MAGFRLPHFRTWDDEKRWAFANLPTEWLNLPAVGFTIDDVTSPHTPAYNCIAYAAKDETQWWWPTPEWMIRMYGLGYHYWPVKRVYPATLENFQEAFRTLGYKPCKSEKPEWAYEKVAIYLNANGLQHMARECGDGVWFSKLGPLQDIRHHVPKGAESADYGEARHFMRKRLGGISRWARIKNRLTKILRHGVPR